MKLIDTIKNPKKIIFSMGMHGGLRFLNDEAYLRLMYWCRFGKKLNLDNPKTFNEKIQWLKLHSDDLLLTRLVDKYEVKQYIAEIIGEEYIIPTLGVWDTFNQIDFDKLPNEFVLKCTHDSGGLIICRDKSKLDIAKARKKINSCLKKNYYWIGRERPYKNVKPRIIAEKYMQDGERIAPEDYKVYCMNGEPRYIVVFHNRYDDNKPLSETVYDVNWIPQHISFDEHFEIDDEVVEKPQCLEELLEVSKKLCADYDQVRVDFYIIENKIYFGEMTFSTASGFQPMIPKEVDEMLGALIELKKIESIKKQSLYAEYK